MRIAIIGCAHGTLDSIYASIRQSEIDSGQTIDLVIICGDFQSIRNEADLDNMAVPAKFRHMGDFHKYYSEQAIAPYLTIFVGGNHESSAYLWELYHGGWVAKNIYFLGWASVIRVGNLRIGGISGIYDAKDYTKGHFEQAPYSPSDIRSIYHTRQHEIMQLSLYKEPIDIFISHDWPRNIAHYGDLDQLLKEKPFFKTDILSGRLGSPALQHLLHHLRPHYWFAGHLHVHFAAIVPHDKPSSTTTNTTTITNRYPDINQFTHLSSSPFNSDTNMTIKENITSSYTRFLALDKAMPRRRFLQIVNIGTDTGMPKLSYDIDWLAIIKATHNQMPCTMNKSIQPYDWSQLNQAVNRARTWLHNQYPDGNHDPRLLIPESHVAFTVTSPYHSDSIDYLRNLANRVHINPQTTTFAQILDINHVTASNNSVQWSDYEMKLKSSIVE